MLGPVAHPERVSVDTSCHDVVPFVEEAVRSKLHRDRPDVWLIAVDDGSTDGTGAPLRDLAAERTAPGRRMVVRRREGAGAAARSAGPARAAGAPVTLLDADDRSDPAHPSAMARAPRGDASLDAVSALHRHVDEEGRTTGEEPPPGRRWSGPGDLMTRMTVQSPLLRAGAAHAAGPVVETPTACIDLHFVMRVAPLRPPNIGLVPQVLSDHRRRSGQITQDWRRMGPNWGRVPDELAARGLGLDPAAFDRAGAGLPLVVDPDLPGGRPRRGPPPDRRDLAPRPELRRARIRTPPVVAALARRGARASRPGRAAAAGTPRGGAGRGSGEGSAARRRAPPVRPIAGRGRVGPARGRRRSTGAAAQPPAS